MEAGGREGYRMFPTLAVAEDGGGRFESDGYSREVASPAAHEHRYGVKQVAREGGGGGAA